MLFGLLTGLGFFAWIVLIYYSKWMNEAMDEVEKTLQADAQRKAQTTTTMTDPEGVEITITKPRKRRIRR